MNLRKIVAFATCIMLFSGCSSTAEKATETGATPPQESAAAVPSGATEPTPTPTPTPTPPPPPNDADPETNQRGNMPVDGGDQVDIIDELLNNAAVAHVTVKSIETNFRCTDPYAMASANGNFIAIEVELQTLPELQNSFNPYVSVLPDFFRVLTPDGTRENDSIGNAHSCLKPSDRIPLEVGPGERVTGMIVLDSSHTTGIIALRFPWMRNAWEWTF